MKKFSPRILLVLIPALFLFTGCQESTSKHAAEPKAPAPTAKPLQATPGLEQDIHVYQEILKKTPDAVDALIGLGNAYMDISRFPEAVQYYQRALKIVPDNVDVRIDMGTCYRKMGQPDRALEAYRKGLAYQPNHANALANMGVVLAYDKQDREEALKVWEKFLKLYPNHNMADAIRHEVKRLRSGRKQSVR